MCRYELAAHAAESGVEPPSTPVIFFKHPNTVIGPVLVSAGDEIVTSIDGLGEQLQYVIGAQLQI